jgi:hypothetical protein
VRSPHPTPRLPSGIRSIGAHRRLSIRRSAHCRTAWVTDRHRRRAVGAPCARCSCRPPAGARRIGPHHRPARRTRPASPPPARLRGATHWRPRGYAPALRRAHRDSRWSTRSTQRTQRRAEHRPYPGAAQGTSSAAEPHRAPPQRTVRAGGFSGDPPSG